LLYLIVLFAEAIRVIAKLLVMQAMLYDENGQDNVSVFRLLLAIDISLKKSGLLLYTSSELIRIIGPYYSWVPLSSKHTLHQLSFSFNSYYEERALA